MVRDNCYNGTEDIDVQLRLFAFSTDVPLYVGTFWDDVDPERAKKVGQGRVWVWVRLRVGVGLIVRAGGCGRGLGPQTSVPLLRGLTPAPTPTLALR